jgi:hypothetical protein
MANDKKPAAKPAQSPQEAALARSAAKSANFKRLASQRVANALAKLNGVKQLSNRNSYSYDNVQVTKILNALKAAVNEIEAAYTAPQTTAAVKSFEL